MEVIRAAAVDDELVAAFARLMPLLNDHSPAPTADELSEIIRTGHLYVAKDPGIVGVLTLTLYRTPSGVNSRIDDVIVATESRGRGIGEALTRAAIEHARRAGARAVNLTSHPRREAANRLYQRLGFERRETNTYVYKLR